ncbi:autotransporter-associated beta strand repeat-containing protein [Lentzea albidocapillata subsp. violacea]|uniref:Autotransporter-associated beta strand repeat-containing protein n=1 Tax=Lentzea albidocapillata subsp. violacea TaxID=128104 RepID=A0A1G9FCN4_9PSEU|nr:phosphatase PAP2 family protein [Lentzea albidocapillata]SDK85983.1 autotransporter-associated beta strand repeat-containing protein [Lentzea albidocapillata subsp. violacea]
MKTADGFDRRTLLRGSVLLSAGALLGPAALDRALEASAAELPTGAAPFVDSYRTNVLANLTPETNAAVRVLAGMRDLWRTGSAWDNGVVLNRDVLTANIRHVARITGARTPDEAKRAFIVDRQHQSYAAIGGLGPLAEMYRAAALAVTGITSAPDGTPPSTVDEKLPPDAPAGSALGAGSPDSALGQVVLLVNTLRGPFASGNPSKYAHQYPRPWRLTPESTVAPAGTTDEFGYPVYRSDVVAAPQLLRQRSFSPTDDGGYPSGHTNALHLACLALAYAIPERFQELVTRAFDLADTRIVAGMHSPADVIGGRILATALAAAALADPQNATLKAAARTQASEYFRQRTGVGLAEYAHSADITTDPYADREANAALVASRLTYNLPRTGRRVPPTVPKGAEVLLETRQPYLSASQRREVLRTTALPSGHALLDGPEQWGRLNLFAAADGYGAFNADVRVDMDANRGGFHAADTWHNAIGGRGGLAKRGTGTLTLAGANTYTGETRVEGGTLVAATATALGAGDIKLRAGTLRLATDEVRVRGSYRQNAGTTLAVTLRPGGCPVLTAARPITLAPGSTLEISLEDARVGDVLPVLAAPVVLGRFSRIDVVGGEHRVTARYGPGGLSVRVQRSS